MQSRTRSDVYYACDDDDINININRGRDKLLSCTLLNARSISSKLAELTVFLQTSKPDFLCITETWLQPADHAIIADMKLRGYQIISFPRGGNKKGEGMLY